MKRLVRTSAGWLEVDVNHLGVRRFGVSVRAASFGEGGWAVLDEAWNPRSPEDDEPLASFIARVAGIRMDEAERIGEESLAEWRSQGGEDDDRRRLLEVMWIVAVLFALAAVGAAAIILGLVALAWKLG